MSRKETITNFKSPWLSNEFSLSVRTIRDLERKVLRTWILMLRYKGFICLRGGKVPCTYLCRQKWEEHRHSAKRNFNSMWRTRSKTKEHAWEFRNLREILLKNGLNHGFVKYYKRNFLQMKIAPAIRGPFLTVCMNWFIKYGKNFRPFPFTKFWF